MDPDKVKALLEFCQVMPKKEDSERYEELGIKETADKCFRDMIGFIDGSTLQGKIDTFDDAHGLIMEYLGIKDDGLVKLYWQLNLEEAKVGDQVEMLKYFVALVYLSHLLQGNVCADRADRMNWVSRLHIEHIISYLSDPSKWKEDDFAKILKMPLNEANTHQMKKTLERVKLSTPRRTPFKQTENFLGLNTSFSSSPTSMFMNSPRIKEKIFLEVNKQVKKEKEEYEGYFKAEYDRILQECDAKEREIVKLKAEKEKIQQKMKGICDGNCEAAKKLGNLEFSYNVLKTRNESQNAVIAACEEQHEKDRNFISTLSSEVFDLKQRCELINDQNEIIDDLKKDLKTKNEAMDNMRLEKRELEAQIRRQDKELRKKIEESEQKNYEKAMEEFKERENKLITELDKVKDEVEELAEKNKELEEKVRGVNKENEDFKEEVQGLKEKNKELEGKAKAMKKENESNKEKIEALMKEKDKLESELKEKKEVEERMKVIEKENEDYKEEVEDLKEQKKEVEDKLKAVEKEKDDFKDKIQGLVEENKTLEGKAEEVEKENEAIKDKVEGLMKENNELEDKLKAICKENEELKKQTLEAASSEELEDLKAKNRSLKAEFDCLKDNLASVSGKTKKLQQRIDDLMEENETLKASNAHQTETSEENSKLTAELSCARQNLKNQNVENLELKKKVEELTNKNEDLRLELDEVKSEVKELEFLKRKTPAKKFCSSNQQDELTYARSITNLKTDPEYQEQLAITPNRVKELQERNARNPPHMRSHYVTELFYDKGSPTVALPKKR
ncbi:unnamed protein product [Bursaphelenchus okinawaensis]|uniref:Uncharacterized protein n=1 Tax=Bursaphelenchus okinawaensis TaxID=465554 RepID=A0A811JVZ4_9BILA|nr:unnamed protein product [Bursaphelenchus okinawaensis]CAG9085602.1 unnamed protein product [Bursaphelenchus okinawaensis]